MFRLLIVPGVTVDKWSRMWSERSPDVELQLIPVEAAHATAALLAAEADAGLIRLPVDQDAFHAIPLYTETTVVLVPRDHLLTAAEEVSVADLADETLLLPIDDVTAGPDTVALVAAGAGVLVVPQSLARLHHRRDLTYRTVTDAPTSSVGLVWPRDQHTDLIEQMIGIVRGRTANSTRGQPQHLPQPQPQKASRRRRR
jgi:DNA-binding transcriptional LysR family regulator